MYNARYSFSDLDWFGGTEMTHPAFFMSMGNIGVAYFTIALAVHTFNTLVLRYRQSAWIGVPVIIVGWGIALAFSLVPLLPSIAVKKIVMYGPGEVTCGVQSVYAKEFFYHHILPVCTKLVVCRDCMADQILKIFITSLLSAILYSLIFLVLRGSLVFKGGVKINLNPAMRSRSGTSNVEEYHNFVLSIGKSMLWYVSGFILCKSANI